jgi:hypothetical protein
VGGDTSASGTFTPAASDPAITGFTVTAQPLPSGAPVTLALGPAATTFAFSAGTLTNGTTYDVTVTATNSVGTSLASNTLQVTPNVGVQPAVASITATPGAPGSGEVNVVWTAPSSGLTPIGYQLTVSPTVAGSPFNLSNSTFSQLVGGLTAGTPYTFTVTPQHTSASATPASAVATPSAAQIIQQELTVERPPGALILTQRCGVYNDLPAWPGENGFPGFPPALPAVSATGDQTGTPPFTTWSDATNSGSNPDTEFGEYPTPSPTTYPTHCGLSLGTATLVSGGNLAGQYYTASGRLNEVTVVDTRDLDSGWTIKGQMEQFTGIDHGDTFSGNYLGWVPVMTDDSDATGSSSYDQTVAAGAVIRPGEGVVSGTGLGTAGGKTLATAGAGAGLGIATLDARVMLLIPLSADADTYTGTLTITALETP